MFILLGMKIMNTTFGSAGTYHTSRMNQVQTPEPTKGQEPTPQSYPPLTIITHIIHTHSETNKFYIEIKPNAYLSEGMSLAIGCFPPDPFLIEFCLVSP